MKSDEQMGQLMRVFGLGKLFGLLYFFTNCLRVVPLDCCWLRLMQLTNSSAATNTSNTVSSLSFIFWLEITK